MVLLIQSQCQDLHKKIYLINAFAKKTKPVTIKTLISKLETPDKRFHQLAYEYYVKSVICHPHFSLTAVSYTRGIDRKHSKPLC